MKTAETRDKFKFLQINKLQLLEILKPFLNIKYIENNASKEVQQFFKQLQYPSIDKQQLKAISEDTENIYIHDILLPISSNFQFDFLLLQNYVKSTNSQHYLVSYALVISWLCLKDFSLNTEVLSLLYDLINQIPSVSNELQTFLIKEIFSHYIQITNTPIEIKLFLKIIASMSTDLLPLFVAEFLTANDDSTKQVTLSIIFNLKDDKFFIQNLQILISGLLPLIEKLDKFGLDFFAQLVNYRDVQSIIGVIQRFPEIIANNIQTKTSFPPVFSFNFPTDGFLDYVFNFDSTNTLPNGLIPLPTNSFDDSLGIEKIASKNEIEIATKIVTFLSFLHIEFANLFFDSIANYVCKRNNDSLYMVFILIFNKIDFTISKNSINAIIHPVVFSSGVSLFNGKIESESNSSSKAISYDAVLSIRKAITNTFIAKQKILIPTLLEHLSESPFLFAEIIGCTHAKLPKEDLKLVITDETIYLLAHQLSLLWHFCVQSKSNEETKNDENQNANINLNKDSSNEDEQISLNKTNDGIINSSNEDEQTNLNKTNDGIINSSNNDDQINLNKTSNENIESSNNDDNDVDSSNCNELENAIDDKNGSGKDASSNNNCQHEIDQSSDLYKFRRARSTIFLFIFSVLDDKNLSIKCFSSPTFANCIVPRILEPSLEKLILTSLSKFLVLCNDKMSMIPTLRMISSVFKVCQSDKTTLVHDLLNIINEALILNGSDILFEPIISSVVSFLNRFPSSTFLTLTLRLFNQISQISDTFSLNHVQIKQLSFAVRQIEENDHSDETISAILGLIGLSHSVTTSSMFLIKKPSLITLIFSILRNEQKLEEILTFFSNLCKHSVFNILQCHRGELDFLLIEMMKNLSKPFFFRGCQFDALSNLELMKNIGLPLIMNIVTVVCNNAVTTKLVRLISLNHEFSIDILNSLNSNFSSLVKLSTQILPINNSVDPTISVKNISGSLINQNFTIQACLFVDNPYSIFLNRQYNLFRLTDENHFSIDFILNGESIICKVSTETDIYTCTLLKEFPKCQWTTIILFFNRKPDDTCKFSLLSKEYYSNDFFIQCPDFRNSKMTLKVGYTDIVNDDDHSEFQGFPCFIGRFALYPIEFTKEMSFATIVTETQISDPLPIFAYPKPKNLNLNQNQSSLQVVENIKCRVKNILDVFTESQVFEFLPLFSPIDQMSDSLVRVLLSLISTVLLYSVPLQSKFSFFPVISKLLMESDSKRLTYSLYMRFFSIIGNCTEPHIISEIIKHILLNFELWIRAEASQLIRIVQHWGTSLYTACDHILTDSINFETLIAMVRMYFWFTPIETNIIRGVNERSQSLDINLCWQHIDRLLTNSIKSKGSSVEIVSTLLSNCASCKDNQQVIHYFTILRENCPERNPEFIKEILFIFNRLKDNDLFIEALKTLYVFSEEKSISYNIYSLLNVVQGLKDNQFSDPNTSFNNQPLHDKLIELLPEYPLIYPLVILNSIYIGKESMISTSKLLGKLIPKSAYKSIIIDEFWMVYLLILAIQIDKPENLSVIYFICSIIIEEFSIELLVDVLAMIDFFDSISEISLSEIRDEILKAVTDLNLTNSSKIKNELFIIGAKTLLLHYEKCSPSLQSTYEDSPFNTEDEEKANEDNFVDSIVSTTVSDSIDTIEDDEQFSSSLAASTKPSEIRNSSILSLSIDGHAIKRPSVDEGIINQHVNNHQSKHVHIIHEKRPKRKSLSRNDDLYMRKVRSYSELSNKNKYQIKNFNSSKNLLDLFSIDPSQIKRYHFGIHLSNDERYHSLLVNICQLLSLSNYSNETNDSNPNQTSSYLPSIVLKRVLQYLSALEENIEKKSRETKVSHLSRFSAFNFTNENNFDEYLRKFFSITSLSWSMKVKGIVNKGRKLFTSLSKSSQFPSSKVGIAFNGIGNYMNFLHSSVDFSNKMTFELERRFGDIIKNKEKRYYKHRFRYTSNFTQPKVSQFAKSCILRSTSKDKLKQRYSTSFVNSSNNAALFQCKCNVIKIINSQKTNFILTKESIILDGLRNVAISSLSYILRRRVLQRKTALEFITNEGQDYLVDFAPYKSKKILKKITSIVHLPETCMIQRVCARKFFTKVNNFTEKWVKREITNFDYLLAMNIFGGRSFRDPSNYPIFPWIISDYKDNDEEKFFVDDQTIYRNLYYPISAQDDERRTDLLQKFDINLPIAEDNLIYFNAPSNPTIVSYWMIHEEPFTSLHLETEGGKFDLSARLFSSISSSAEQAKSNSSCWELTPEFYYKPEIFLNLNNIEFKGSENDLKEEKDDVSDEAERILKIFDRKGNVVLPNWCHKNPFELVYFLRKALESEYVSRHLDDWIDMMFGIASFGDSAKEHFNVFSPILLSNIWKVNHYKSCPKDRKEFIETSLSKSGQIPETLFKVKHPKRNRDTRRVSEFFDLEGSEKPKPKVEVLSLISRNDDNEEEVTLNDDRNSIKAALLLFESQNRFKVIYILKSGRIETYVVSISISSSLSLGITPNDSITSSSTEIFNPNDFSSSEELQSDATKREFVVLKDPNERFLNDVDEKCKYHSLDNGIIVVNKDKLLFVTENSISSYSNSSISNSSISSLFESDLLICESSDTISIVNCEGVIYSSSYVLSNSSSSSSSSFLSSSFLMFRSFSSPNLEDSSSSAEVLTLASLTTPHSKMNIFSKSGKKVEYELDFKQIGRAHCEKPLVISSSKKFDILAVTSIEGNVNVYSLLSGIYECTCYTADEPAENILITSGWGFILVSTIQFLYLFNVNGFLIRKVPKTFNIAQWCTWTDDKGFDFVAIVKDDGSVVCCEAFFLNFLEPIQIIRDPPVVMKYFDELNSLLIVTKNRKLVSVPLSK